MTQIQSATIATSQATLRANAAPEKDRVPHVADTTRVIALPGTVAMTTDTTEDPPTVGTPTAGNAMTDATTGHVTADREAVTDLRRTDRAPAIAGKTGASAAEVLLRTEAATTTRSDPHLHTAGETTETKVINSDKNKLSLNPSDRLPFTQVLTCI